MRFGLTSDLVNPHPIIEDLYIYLRDKLFSRNSLALCSNTELHLVRLSWKAKSAQLGGGLQFSRILQIWRADLSTIIVDRFRRLIKAEMELRTS